MSAFFCGAGQGDNLCVQDDLRFADNGENGVFENIFFHIENLININEFKKT